MRALESITNGMVQVTAVTVPLYVGCLTHTVLRLTVDLVVHLKYNLTLFEVF
jgi:hypothetical protein